MSLTLVCSLQFIKHVFYQYASTITHCICIYEVIVWGRWEFDAREINGQSVHANTTVWSLIGWKVYLCVLCIYSRMPLDGFNSNVVNFH